MGEVAWVPLREATAIQVAAVVAGLEVVVMATKSRVAVVAATSLRPFSPGVSCTPSWQALRGLVASEYLVVHAHEGTFLRDVAQVILQGCHLARKEFFTSSALSQPP